MYVTTEERPSNHVTGSGKRGPLSSQIAGGVKLFISVIVHI